MQCVFFHDCSVDNVHLDLILLVSISSEVSVKDRMCEGSSSKVVPASISLEAPEIFDSFERKTLCRSVILKFRPFLL